MRFFYKHKDPKIADTLLVGCESVCQVGTTLVVRVNGTVHIFDTGALTYWEVLNERS